MHPAEGWWHVYTYIYKYIYKQTPGINHKNVLFPGWKEAAFTRCSMTLQDNSESLIKPMALR